MTVAKITKGIADLKLSFNRKAWTRKHLKKKVSCKRCLCRVCAHMLKRHQKTAKCRYLAQIVMRFRM